jgi:hypothetical protein
MTDRIENQLIAELSRRVVSEVAPKERRVFQPISEAYFKNPEKTLKGEGGDDELIGFGMGEVALILTPFIIDIVKDVLKDLLKDSMKDSFKKNAPTLVEKLKAFFGNLFGSNSSDSISTQSAVQLLLPLEQGQLVQARQRAYNRAIYLGVDENKASLIADSVVNTLQLPLEPFN